jgi:23S rRNA (guanosine2251-2'-O)-methyltransferase
MLNLVREARARGIQISFEDRRALDGLSGGASHQGVVAFVSDYSYADMGDMLKAAADRGEPPLIVVLDGIEDPHNLGAVIRTAECAGAHGVVIPKRRAAGLTDTVAKTSAGAIEHVPVARVGNLSRAIGELKEAGLWAAALDMGGQPYFGMDLTGGLALVVGGEGAGLGRLVRESCDFAVSIPMSGRIGSLNASNAAAVLLYEARRQRSTGKGG